MAQNFIVAKISEDAMTALSLVYPVQNLMTAIAVGFGIGINARIAFCLGAEDKEQADTAAATGISFFCDNYAWHFSGKNISGCGQNESFDDQHDMRLCRKYCAGSIDDFWNRTVPVSFEKKKISFNRQVIKPLYAVGIPASLNMALPSLLISSLNGILAGFSGSYVLVLGAYYKLQTFIYLFGYTEKIRTRRNSYG